ncbi:hypothetical protein PM082_021222 [Marasmius tenuissimus]|nr:hypothetical protein PM082_021222 [Marasmius tenuissimus]
MFSFKAVAALALAGASAYAASPLESREPGPLGERVHCGILLRPSPQLPTNWDREAYKAELGQVIGGEISRQSPSHDVQSDLQLWAQDTTGDYWRTIGGVSTSGLNGEDLEKLIRSLTGKDLSGTLTANWHVVGVDGCFYASKST